MATSDDVDDADGGDTEKYVFLLVGVLSPVSQGGLR